jgi:hypothetical protein
MQASSMKQATQQAHRKMTLDGAGKQVKNDRKNALFSD